MNTVHIPPCGHNARSDCDNVFHVGYFQRIRYTCLNSFIYDDLLAVKSFESVLDVKLKFSNLFALQWLETWDVTSASRRIPPSVS